MFWIGSDQEVLNGATKKIFLWFSWFPLPLVDHMRSLKMADEFSKTGRDIVITMTSWWALWRLKSPALWLFPQPFIRAQIKKISNLCITGLCEENSPVTGEFSAQRASDAENAVIWWRHHGSVTVCLYIFQNEAALFAAGSHQQCQVVWHSCLLHRVIASHDFFAQCTSPQWKWTPSLRIGWHTKEPQRFKGRWESKEADEPYSSLAKCALTLGYRRWSKETHVQWLFCT